MAESSCRFQVTGGMAVVTAPDEIDIGTASHLRTALLRAGIGGHSTVVVDMSHTRLCDSAGLHVLVRAHKRALANGGGLRLVLPVGAAVRRIFAVTGVNRVIPDFPSLQQALVADTRACEQCGAVFAPQREHDRFCGAHCRASWNREHLCDPAVEASALQWSVTAMIEATGRLPGIKVGDQQRALAALGEAVWWITIVDATLARHHPEVYEAMLSARGPAQQLLTDAALAGLRFVRNQVDREAGLEELIGRELPATGHSITDWTWKRAPEEPVSPPPGGQTWDTARYRAYRSYCCGLVGRTIGETFERAVAFLTLTGAHVARTAEDPVGARG